MLRAGLGARVTRPTFPPGLATLLHAAQVEELGFPEILRRAAEADVPLPALIDAIEFGDFYFDDGRGRDEAVLHLADDGGDAWLDDLVAALGSEEAAQEVLAHTRYWCIRVTEQREDRRVRTMLQRATADPSRPSRLARALTAAGRREGVAGIIPETLSTVVRAWPLPVVVQQTWFPVSVLRVELPKRGSWTDILAHLVEALGRGPAVDAVARIIGVQVPEGSERERYWHLRCRLASLTGSPLWSVVTPMMTEMSDGSWVGIAREHGFPADQAALGLLESGRSLRVTTAALCGAGWSPAEVLAALLVRDAAPPASLEAWHRGGFTEEGMVEALREDAVPEQEIRVLLLGLRVPEARVQRLLRGR